jgi:hypothetical protein
MCERRRFSRYAVAWPVRLWLNEHVMLRGQTTDASVKGMRIVLDSPPPEALKIGERYRVEVMPERGDRFACFAEVRHIGKAGIGLENLVEVPLSLILRDATSRPDEV